MVGGDDSFLDLSRPFCPSGGIELVSFMVVFWVVVQLDLCLDD